MIALGIAAAPAGAALSWLPSWEGKVRFTVSPEGKIPLASPVVIEWKTDRALRRSQAYQVTFNVSATGRTLATDPRPVGCAEKVVRLVGRGSPRGRKIRVTFDPRWVNGASAWCDSVSGWFTALPLELNAAGQADLKVQQTLEVVPMVPSYGSGGTIRMDGTPPPTPAMPLVITR